MKPCKSAQLPVASQQLGNSKTGCKRNRGLMHIIAATMVGDSFEGLLKKQLTLGVADLDYEIDWFLDFQLIHKGI